MSKDLSPRAWHTPTAILIKISWKIFKNNWRQSWPLVLILILGLLGPAMVNSARDGILSMFQKHQKSITGADIVVSSRQNISPEEMNNIKKNLPKNYQMVYTPTCYSMAAIEMRQTLVHIETFDEQYPYYGGLTFRDHSRFPQDKKIIGHSSIWIEENLARVLEVKENDQIKIGDHFFVIEKVVIDDTSAVFEMNSMTYKVYMHAQTFLEKNYKQNGSTLTHLYHIKLENSNDAEVESIAKKIDMKVNDPAINILSYHKVSDQITKGLQYLFDFLSLSTLISLILAALSLFFLGLGKYSSQKNNFDYLFEQGFYKKDIAQILRFEFLLMQMIALPISLLVFYISSPLLESQLLSFTNLPISIFHIKPYLVVSIVSLAFNQLVFEYLIQGHYHENKKMSQIILGSFGLSLFFLAVLLSHSWIIGTIFSLTISISLIILWPMTTPLLKCCEKLSEKCKYPISYFLKSLSRFPSFSRLQISALSFALALLILIANLEKSLRLELAEDNKDLFRPDFFAFDIQEEQISALEKLVREFNGSLMALSPLIRARIIAVNDKPYEKIRQEAQTREDERELRMRNRGANISYRAHLDPSEEVVEGVFFKGPYDPQKMQWAEISLEKRYAQRLGLKLNDRIVFNVLDVPIKTQVTSIRKVRWTSFRPNFFINIQPGVLEDAPKSYLTGIGNLSNDKKVEFQTELFKRAPNISSLDVKKILDKITGLLNQMSLALKIMASLIFLQGLLLFTSAGTNKIWQRRQEFLTLRLIGVTRTHIIMQFLFDMVILITTSVVISLFIGSIISFCILKFALLLPFTNAVSVNIMSLLTITCCIIIFVMIGMFPLLWKIVNRPVQELIAE